MEGGSKFARHAGACSSELRKGGASVQGAEQPVVEKNVADGKALGGVMALVGVMEWMAQEPDIPVPPFQCQNGGQRRRVWPGSGPVPLDNAGSGKGRSGCCRERAGPCGLFRFYIKRAFV